MKNKILALLCALTILLPCTVANAGFIDIPENTKEEKILNIIQNLGIMNGYEDGSFRPDNPITRAEFVTTIHNAVKIWKNVAGVSGDGSDFDWAAFFLNGGANGMGLMYPDSGESTDGETTVRTSLWTDVEEDYWAYPYLKMVASFGYVVGYPDGTFKPTRTVTYNEAIAVLLNLCGYAEHAAARGGYPEGYNVIANRYELYKGLYATGDQELSRMDAASLIYNAFELEMAPTSVDSNEEKRTFLNDVVGVYIVEGTLTDTDITSIYRQEPLMQYEASVNGVDFSFTASDKQIREYIGQEVRVYLIPDDEISDEYKLMSFELVGKEDITVIDADLFEDYAGNTFYYKKNKDDRNNKKVEVRSGSVLIYNGKYETNFTKELFENINKGTITIVEKKEYAFDIVIVEDFKTGYTEKIGGAELEIYDSIADGVGNSIIPTSKLEDGTSVVAELMNADGESITIDDISKGAINYYVNDDFVKLYYSDKTVSGNIAKESDDEDTYYAVDGEKYKISDRYMDYTKSNLRTNFDGVMTLDRYNEVVWVTDERDISGYAYIIKVRFNYETEQLILTYYDIDSDSVKENVLTDAEVKLYGTDGVLTDFTGQGIIDEINANKETIVKLEFNDEGNVKKIRYALEEQDGSSDKLQLIRSFTDLTRYRQTMGFNGEYYLNANSKLITIPYDRTEYRKYVKADYTKDITEIDAKLYSFDPESPYANIALVYLQDVASTSFTFETTTKTYIVTKISKSINADGELTTEATLFDGSTYSTASSVEDENGVSAFENAYYATDNTRGLTVERGDFIVYMTDSVTGDVTKVKILYDANAVNPAWCSPDTTNKPTTCTLNHTHTSLLGHFPGSTGFEVKGAVNTNPIAFQNTAAYTGGEGKVPGIRSNYIMLVSGFVYQEKEGMYEWTTQNIVEGWNGERDKDNYKWIYDNFSGTNPKVFIVNEDMTIETGSLQSIKTYKDAGNKCSKLLMRYTGGTIAQIWILK